MGELDAFVVGDRIKLSHDGDYYGEAIVVDPESDDLGVAIEDMASEPTTRLFILPRRHLSGHDANEAAVEDLIEARLTPASGDKHS